MPSERVVLLTRNFGSIHIEDSNGPRAGNGRVTRVMPDRRDATRNSRGGPRRHDAIFRYPLQSEE